MLEYNAICPIPVLPEPEVFFQSACLPTAVMSFPDVFAFAASKPTAVFWLPEVLEYNALYPIPTELVAETTPPMATVLLLSKCVFIGNPVSPEPSPENLVAVTVPDIFAPVEEITPDVTEIPSNFFAKRAIGTAPIEIKFSAVRIGSKIFGQRT